MRPIRLLACLCVLLSCITRAIASEGPPPKLQPRTYFSPSGEFSLFVNPSDQYGVGPATCTLKRAQEIIWSRSVPFSFWEAAVTDDGRAAGYAYSHGFQGWGASGGYGDLIIALIARDGSEIARDTIPRTDSGMFICPPDRQPSPRGLVFQPALNRVAIRLTGKTGDLSNRDERWWLYSLADGKRSGEITLKAPPGNEKLFYFAIDADAVPGTDLTLVLWSRADWLNNAARKEGVRLALVDKDAAEVWSREWPDEFTSLQYFSPWLLKDDDVTPRDRFTTGRFVYRSFGQQATLAFAVTRSDSGAWKVEDAGSTPEAVQLGRFPATKLLPVTPAEAPRPPAALDPLGEIVLGAGNPSDELDIFEFAFDDRSRCGFIRSTDADASEFILLSPDDPAPLKTAIRIPIPLPEDRKAGHLASAWVGGDKWVILQTPTDEHLKPVAWILDVPAATLAPVADFACPRTSLGHSLISGGEHGFAVIGAYNEGGVTRYDSTGKRRDTLLPRSKVEDCCFRPDGSLGILINISYLILTFDPAGNQTSELKLAQGFGCKPEYVTGIEPDAGNGWIVHDFAGKPPVHRISGKNTPRDSFAPRFPDGRTFRLYGGVRRAPNGRIWTSDRAALLRLDEHGEVDLVIGARPDAETLSEIRAAAVDGAGRIYLLDGHSGITHVFDSRGANIALRRPNPKDFPTDCGLGSLTVAADGEVYCRPSSIGTGESRYLHFNAAGERVGFEPRRSGEVCDEWFFRPGGREMLVLGYERAFLYDADGKQVRTLERRADNLWLSSPEHAAVAPDGSFAIVARGSLGDSKTHPSVTLFSPAGDALQTVELPNRSILNRVAASNRLVAVLGNSQLFAVDRASGKTASYPVPDSSKGKNWLLPFFSPDGSEIWVLDTTTRKLNRFRTPSLN